MTTVTVWILMTFVGNKAGFQYSPPVATQESCEVMRTQAIKLGKGSSYCMKVEIVK